ncbi:MAG TPA: ankyrin repeat domain-containing protein [Chloroflexia bacterium]|nr:ankyrin repeat domain-containing protein [Chloroflexia bacterium]
MDEAKTRNTVLSVRVDDATAGTLDLLVQAGLASSRSEAAAQLMAIGINAATDLLAEARQLAVGLQRLRGNMLTAIKAKDVAAVRDLLDRTPALIHHTAEDDETPVLLATYHGAQDITQLLLERGAELNLFEAAAVGDVERLRQLLDAEPAAIQAYSHDGWTLLHLAAHFGRQPAVEFLLARAADVTAESRNAMTNLPLHAALAGRRTAVARLLIAHGSPVQARDSYGLTALHHLAYSGDTELAETVLAAGADLDARDTAGRTALAIAREKEHTALAAILQQHGAR